MSAMPDAFVSHSLEASTGLLLPDTFVSALHEGADSGIGVSGGKDSQALLTRYLGWHRDQGFSGQVFAIWVNLGRAERTETPGFLDFLCARLEVPLETVVPVVGGQPGDLQERFRQRKEKLADTETPFWPTRGLRYCTSLKRAACDKHFRGSRLIASLEGIRADESEERAEKEPFTVRQTITGKRYKTLSPEVAFKNYQDDLAEAKQTLVPFSMFDADEDEERVGKIPRLAFTLYPLFHWTLDDVWAACGTSQQELEERRALYKEGIERQDPAIRAQALNGFPAHPAYVKGAHRLSCSLCILADRETLRSGAYNNPSYYRALVWYEIESGYPFQQNRWLAAIAPELLTDEQQATLSALPQWQAWQEKKSKRKVLPMYPR